MSQRHDFRLIPSSVGPIAARLTNAVSGGNVSLGVSKWPLACYLQIIRIPSLLPAGEKR